MKMIKKIVLELIELDVFNIFCQVISNYPAILFLTQKDYFE